VSPEELAARVLRVSQMQPPIDVSRLIEAHSVDLDSYSFADDFLGMYLRIPRPVIVVNARHPRNRRRFTLAHEFCHHMLHKRTKHVLRFNAGRPATKEECYANSFAAALLMPADLVCGLHKRGAPVDAMCTVMGVSKQAMNIRLDELKREGRL